MIEVETGSTVLLTLVNKEGTTTLFPQGEVYDSAASLVATVNLAHTANGLYQGTVAAPVAGNYSIIFITYTDAGHTIVADIERASEELRVVLPFESRLLPVLQANVVPGSLGEALIAMRAEAGLYVRIDAQTYDGNNRLLTARRRAFANDTDTGNSTFGGSGEGELLTMTDIATHTTREQWKDLVRTKP